MKLSWTRLAVFFAAASFEGACSGGNVVDGVPPSLDGTWCGMPVEGADQCVGDEIHYAELEQSGSTVTGVSCEAVGKDCYSIVEGTVSGTEVSYAYEFSGYRVSVELTLSGDGRSLEGAAFSTKCGCEFPWTLYRIGG